MSLKSFTKLPDVKARLKPLRPKLPRGLSAPLQVQPRSQRYQLVGTAFDYLLRFELQRLAPHAVTGKWSAEYAPEMISGGLELFADLEPPDYLPPKEVARRASSILQNAKEAVAAYLRCGEPARAQQVDLATHAIRLAKLDSVVRAMRLDRRFEEADQEDVDDLLAMLAIVPFATLVHSQVMLLNPTFGEASALVGGADADLVAGDMLVDLKATKNNKVAAEDLDQLLGYFLLARRHRLANPTFPEIKRLALYFARNGHLWAQDTTAWTTHQQFAEVEQWFSQWAEQSHAAAPKSAGSPKRGGPSLFVCFGGNCNMGVITLGDSKEFRKVGALGSSFTTRDRKGRFWQFYEAKESPDPARVAEEAAAIQRVLDRKGAGNGKVEVREFACQRIELHNLLDQHVG
jgi:hypothetical protein